MLFLVNTTDKLDESMADSLVKAGHVKALWKDLVANKMFSLKIESGGKGKKRASTFDCGEISTEIQKHQKHAPGKLTRCIYGELQA